MKLITLSLLILITAASCSNKKDLDVQDGTYRTFSPVSINGELINDLWTIEGDRFSITRDGQEIYAIEGVWNLDHLELFPYGDNPYYKTSMKGATIVTVDFGFYLYPNYPTTDITFCLQRQN